MLLIGINHYNDPAFSPLHHSVGDCQGVEAILERVTVGYFASRQFLIHNDLTTAQPTLGAVLSSLEAIACQAKPQDVLLIYFSGHGAMSSEKFFFCLADTGHDTLEMTGLPLECLLSYLEKCPASQQLLWSDACYSGRLHVETNQAALFGDLLQTRARQNQGFYALLSCTASQRAWEFPELNHGVFTYFLIKGLEGGAANEQKLVEVDQLYAYVYLQTEGFINDINRQRRFLNAQNTEGGTGNLEEYPLQTPNRIVGGAGRLVLGYCPTPGVSTVQRQALIVHEFVNSETNLAFCRALREYGDFTLSYWREENTLLSEQENIQKNRQDLQSGIVRLLTSDLKATVLLYFRGHLQRQDGEMWLMCSDTVGVKQTWLREVLNEARVAHWVLILDCPGAKNFYDLLAPERPQSFGILAAETITFAQVLTQTLSEADAKFGLSLPAWIVSLEKCLKAQQQKLYRWLGGDNCLMIILPENRNPPRNRDLNLCPYLGLKTFAEAEASYFCGRNEITAELLHRLEDRSFLAVVGASGSGKSSVVQAGLIPKLRQGQLSNSQSWKIQTMRPGFAPLDALARVLAGPEESFAFIKVQLYFGAQGFLEYLYSRSEPCLLLVIDQFEELLTLTPEEERNLFLNVLLGALAEISHKHFKVVITLRSDFYVCDQLPKELNRRMSQSNLTLIPMETSAYREAIEKPAQRVGLEVEQSLVIQLLEDLKGAAGDLPLLAFVLQELWTKRQNGKLTLAAYQQMEGIQGTLTRRANDIYAEMDAAEKDCLRWILISLTKIGKEGPLDSRQRILKDKLFIPGYPKSLVEKTLKRLIDEKLVVVDFGEQNQVVVEVAHEVLIRKWDKLEQWLDESREQLQILRDFQSKAEKWLKEEEKEEYLLRGSQLEKIEIAPVDITNKLSQDEQRYLQACKDKRTEIQQKERRSLRTAKSVTLVVSLLLVVTGFSAVIATQRTQQVQQNLIDDLNTSAQRERDRDPRYALMKSIEAAYLLKHTFDVSPELTSQTTSTLRSMLAVNQKINKLDSPTDRMQRAANIDSLLKQSCSELRDYLRSNQTLTNQQQEMCQEPR